MGGPPVGPEWSSGPPGSLGVDGIPLEGCEGREALPEGWDR